MAMKKKLAALAFLGAFTFGMAAPAVANFGEEPPPAETRKCNSGRGNNSETTPETDCDPGNSGGHNNGGD